MSEISKDLLRPCPLCGGEAKLQESNYFRYARVFCTKCGLSTMEYPMIENGKDKLIKLWNSRIDGKEQKNGNGKE